MQKDELPAFLEEAASYFEHRSTGGEDSAHWANVYNAENCRKAAAEIRRLQALAEEAREVVAPFADLGSVWSKTDEWDDSPWTKTADDIRLTVGADHIGWNHVTVGNLRRAFALSARLDASPPPVGV